MHINITNLNGYPDYTFSKNNKYLKIFFTNNLYWSFDDLSSDVPVDYGSFIITKENSFIYNLFNKLYNNITYTRKKFFDGKNITWVSNNNIYNKDSILKISKEEDNIILEFAKREKKDSDHLMNEINYTINIMFNSDLINYPFLNMYHQLISYKLEYGEMPARSFTEIPGQLHIEEYIDEEIHKNQILTKKC